MSFYNFFGGKQETFLSIVSHSNFFRTDSFSYLFTPPPYLFIDGNKVSSRECFQGYKKPPFAVGMYFPPIFGESFCCILSSACMPSFRSLLGLVAKKNILVDGGIFGWYMMMVLSCFFGILCQIGNCFFVSSSTTPHYSNVATKSCNFYYGGLAS